MAGLKARVTESAAAFSDVLRNRDLRRLELAWTASILGQWAYLVAVSVYAFGVGGDAAVGLILFLRLVPAGLIAPFAGVLADRYPRQRVLLACNTARMVLIGAAAFAVYMDATPAVVYALAVAAAIVTTPFRSALAALTPSLARSPRELTAANAVASTIESIAVFAGAALAGALLTVAGSATVFLVMVGLVGVSTVFVLGIRAPQPDRRPEREAGTIASEALLGFRTIASHRSLRVLVGLLTCITLVSGALQVYIVVTSIDLLDLGNAGVGYLNSAEGFGGLIGGVLALSLTGAKRLSPAVMLGIVLWGVPLLVIGLWPQAALAIALFVVIGIGTSLMDVAALTLVQRSVPDAVLARVFGVLQMLWLGSIGIGALLAPVLIGAVGIETALIVTGAALPAIMALSARRLAGIDAAASAPDASELRLLTSVPIFAPLPGMTLEHLAGRLVPLRVDAGTVVVREGDAGDRFYIVAEGELDVSAQGETMTELKSGDYFGEIALIRNVPRTATVTARAPVVLYALDREDFLAAVTEHAPSAEAAETVVSTRLAAPATTDVGARSP